MAMKWPDRYPGRWSPTSAEYPQGKFKNRTSPTAKDGSFCEMDWANDWAGFIGAILRNGNVTPNGSVDTAQQSQIYNALMNVILSVLPKRSFQQDDFIRVPDVPGGLIIQWVRPTFAGNNTSVGGSTVVGTVVLPTIFPTSNLIAVVSTLGQFSSGGEDTENMVFVDSINNSQVSIRATRVSGTYTPLEKLTTCVLSVGF